VSALSPSELGGLPSGTRVRVGGRVVAVAEGAIELADALAAVPVGLASARELGVGDLVVIEGRVHERALVDAVLIARTPLPEPRGDGDFARFAWHGIGRNLVARAKALAAVRAYFAREAFLEVETPFRVPAPGVDLHLDALPAHAGHLITSPELQMKRLLVAGLPRIFQVARVSRRDELGQVHEPEFTMLEWYRAFAGIEQVMNDTEQVAREVARAVSGSARLFGADGRRFELELPFPRITVREAFREHAGIADASDLAASDEARYFELMVERVEPGLAQESRPFFLWQYPASQASLARLNPEDPSVAERFELFVGGVELCNGFDELTDAREQRARFEHECALRARAGRTVYPVDERFLAALEAGMPPAGGNAVGFDRLLMLALGARQLAEVIALPSHAL